MGGLTTRQAAALAFITRYIEDHDGASPIFAEIGDYLGLRSKGSVARVVDQLVERGYLGRSNPHGARSLEVLRRPGEMGRATQVANDPVMPGTGPRYEALADLLLAHFSLALGHDIAVPGRSAVRWLAVWLMEEPDDAGVHARLRRVSGALANAAGELAR